MQEKQLQRILRTAQVPDLVEVLAERLSATDLQSLMLAVYRQRVAQLTPQQVSRQYTSNRFVRPAVADARALLALDQLAFSLLPDGFQPLTLAPVCPLGTSAALTGISQDKAVSTARNTEVMADPTNMLALEAAQRRLSLRQQADTRQQEVRLAASQRVLRPQLFDHPRAHAHFHLFALCTAGRRQPDWAFVVQALQGHIRFYLRLIIAAAQLGHPVQDLRVFLTDLESDERLSLWQTQVLDPLGVEFPEVTFHFDQTRTAGRGYYERVCFQINGRNHTGEDLGLVDGGLTNWTQQLLSDRRERLLTSGIGSERLVTAYGKGA